VAGIELDPAEPGYRHVLFQPQPGGGLTCARAMHDSPYGLVASLWELTEAGFRLRITVPPNAHATVRLPARSLAALSEGNRPLTTGNGILSARVAGEVAIIEVGSGDYDLFTTGLNLAQAMAGVRHVAGRLDRHSTVRDLVASTAARTVMDRQLGPVLPHVLDLDWALDLPLEQLADLAPQVLTPEMLHAIERALDPDV
jgi:hypothetical protein